MHPGGGPFELNDTVDGPWLATLTVTKAYRIQWLDKVRTVIECDPSTLMTEYVTTTAKFNVGGVFYDSLPDTENTR